MYQVNFYNNKGKRVEFCHFFLLEGEGLFDKLEEVLYIMCELTPCARGWQGELSKSNRCFYTYHGVETVRVEWDGKDTFTATDID